MANKNPTAPPSLGRALNLTAGTGSAVANALLAAHGLSLAQWAVLMCLWRNGPLGIKAIADLTGNAPPAASRIVDRMVAAGLVQRAPDPEDRRAVVVALTDRAEAMRDLQRVYLEVNAVLAAGLSEAETAQLFDLLDRVRRAGQGWLDSTGKSL